MARGGKTIVEPLSVSAMEQGPLRPARVGDVDHHSSSIGLAKAEVALTDQAGKDLGVGGMCNSANRAPARGPGHAKRVRQPVGGAPMSRARRAAILFRRFRRQP